MGRFALEETEIITFAHNEGKEKLKIFFFLPYQSLFTFLRKKRKQSQKNRENEDVFEQK